MGGGKNLLTKLSRPMVIGEDSIRSGYYMLPDIVVGVSSEFFLIQRHPVEFHVFCHLIHDDYKLLEQPVTVVNQIEILRSFHCPLLPAGEMEDCKVMSSETFVAVRALLQARVPALGARREQQGEVKRHGTLVLLGDNFEAPIPLGDQQVVSSVIAEHGNLLQADRTIVAALVFACWSSTCRDNQPTGGQLFIWNLYNLAVVLDVGIISLEEFLYFKEDFTKLASLLNRNVLRYREIGKPCGKLQAWIKDIELGEDWRFSIPCLQGPSKLMRLALEDDSWCVARLPFVGLQGAQTAAVVEGPDVLFEDLAFRFRLLVVWPVQVDKFLSRTWEAGYLYLAIHAAQLWWLSFELESLAEGTHLIHGTNGIGRIFQCRYMERSFKHLL